MKSVVYLITDGRYYKIGYSSDVQARLSNLQTSHHTRLMIVATRDGGYNLEQQIHRVCEPFKLAGEWFDLSYEALADVMALGFEVYESLHTGKTHKGERQNDHLRKKIGSAVVRFIRDKYKSNTIKATAKHTGLNGRSLEKLIERKSSPSAEALVLMMKAYGPDFIVAIWPDDEIPDWLDRAVRGERQAQLDAKIAALVAEREALR